MHTAAEAKSVSPVQRTANSKFLTAVQSEDFNARALYKSQGRVVHAARITAHLCIRWWCTELILSKENLCNTARDCSNSDKGLTENIMIPLSIPPPNARSSLRTGFAFDVSMHAFGQRSAIYQDWREEAPELYGTPGDSEVPHLTLSPGVSELCVSCLLLNLLDVEVLANDSAELRNSRILELQSLAGQRKSGILELQSLAAQHSSC